MQKEIMVYKKYIKRGKRLYGPYFYSSKRVGDKVVTEYVRQDEKNNSNTNIISPPAVYPTKRNNLFLIIPIVLVALLLILGIVFISMPQQPTGKVVLQSRPSYQQGELVDGKLNVVLKAGELLPSNTEVRVSLGSQEKSISLNQLVSEKTSEGSYFIEDKKISGAGNGYGVEGEAEITPEITFLLRIYKEAGDDSGDDSGQAEETPTENPTENPEQAEETPTETPTDTPSENSAPGDNSVGGDDSGGSASSGDDSGDDSGGGIGITGAVISEETLDIEGSASKGHPFSYRLKEGERAEIIKGSVKVDGEPLKYNVIALDEHQGVVEVETDYSYKESGFGADYIGDKTLSLSINLADFGILAEPGELKVGMIYNAVDLVSESTDLNVIPSPEENATEIPEENLTIPAENITLNETNLSLLLVKPIEDVALKKDENTSLNLEDYFLNAESYSALSPEHITITIDKNTAIIIPEENYTGSTTAKIVASIGSQSLESNFNIIVSETSINVTTIQKRARLGQPVKWEKKIDLEQADNITIDIPKDAENIVVNKIEIRDGEEVKEEVDNVITGNVITGNLILKIQVEQKKEGLLTRLWKKLFGVTGRVIDEQVVNEEKVEEEVKQVAIEENATNFSIEYETPAPYAVESVKSDSEKEIVIVGPESVHYTDVIAYTELSKEVDESQVKLYWIINNSREEVAIDKFDTNNNSLIDYIEWNVPSLSNQTYELILITKAVHLDSNRSFIEDIYDVVKEQDNNWSLIPAGDYVRVTFEKNLTNENDITLYARKAGSGISQIEVYIMDENNSIAKFDNISEEGEYKIYLKNISDGEGYETFDLKVLDDVEIDYIVDPSWIAISNCTSLQAMNASLSGLYYLTNDIDCSDTVNWDNQSGDCMFDFNNNATCSSHAGCTSNFMACWNYGYDESSCIALGGNCTWTGDTCVGTDYSHFDICTGTYYVTRGFLPIGGWYDPVYTYLPFTGTLNGRGYKITGLYMRKDKTSDDSHYGLFAQLNGTVRNLGLADVNITSFYTSGAIAGSINSVARINNSWANGTIYCYGACGGLVGYSVYGSLITNSWADVNVISRYDNYFGGLIGYNYGTIRNCYARGDVSGTQNLCGGFTGMNANSYGVINNSYSTGNVNCSGGTKGAFMSGYSGHYGTIQASFWDNQTSLSTGVGSDLYNRSTADMKTESTFTSVGWDFTNIWNINESVNDGYPNLGTSFASANITTASVVNLTSPGNGTASSSASTTFSASFTEDDANLVNATLYIWEAGSVINTTKVDISGISNSSSIAVSLAMGNYTWNYFACNNFGNCQFAANNFSF